MTDAPDLLARLDAPLPTAVAVGAGSAVFAAGWSVARSGRIEALAVAVDGVAQPVAHHSAPRLDVLRALHPGLDPFATAGLATDPESADDPLLHGYRSGFWGVVSLAPRPGREPYELTLRATLAGGAEVVAPLGAIAVAELEDPLPVPVPPAGDAPLVAICMATYDPADDLLARQLASIRGQAHGNWVCVISDDCSSPQRFAALEAAVAGDPRFVLSRSSVRRGFYGNFERALALAPREAPYIALADQDDDWHPDKLTTLLAELGDAALVYSDARIVDEDGRVRSHTYWRERRNDHSDLLSLLVANSVTGAASLLRRELLDVALPFPPAQFAHFHDHWLALCALCTGEIAFVDRPLYDYVQHGDAWLGHAAANRVVSLRSRLAGARRDPRERIRTWRMIYFVDVCRLLQVVDILLARCGGRMPRPKRRVLERFRSTDGSILSLARLLRRGVRELTGRPVTLGAELVLSYAFIWRRLLAATTRDRPTRGLRLDAVPPPALDPRPGRQGLTAPGPRAVHEKVAPLPLAVRDDAPARINLLVPTVDLAHFFGGYIGKLNLAGRLAARGHRVRLVTVDPVAPLPADWRGQVEAYSGLAGVFGRVEVAFGRGGPPLEVSRADRFIATTWWTAHVADAARRALGAERFLYLIQEYEPFTFPMGTYAALAAGSYDLPHAAVFSTELLRGYFRAHGIGVYAGGATAGDAASIAFENAITAIAPPTAEALRGRSTRRLLFYARPEAHAERNMFELGVLALHRAGERGALRGWELRGIGTTARGRRLELGAGLALELLPRAAQGAYGDRLREHDVGLALMYTPHPSLVPIEMASAGMLVVTNTFENKTAAALVEISSNLLPVAPTVEGVAAGIEAAVAGAADAERRAAGSAVRWSRDWADSFDDALMTRVEALLGA